MNREKTKKAAEVMLAFADGKAIESTWHDREDWQPIETPGWNWGLWRYRIKPQWTFRLYLSDTHSCCQLDFDSREKAEEAWNMQLNRGQAVSAIKEVA